MKNVYMIQPMDIRYKQVYLPYATGTIIAYSFSRKDICDSYNFGGFYFLKDPFEQVIDSIKSPCVVGFSNYLWSIEYNLVLAEKIKNKWPEAVIVFGGPQVPDDVTYLEDYSFIDVLINGEGEEPFYEILKAVDGEGDFSGIANIAYRENGSPVKNPRKYGMDIKDYPSPYQMGLFDDILADDRYKGFQFDSILETNRGCPYNCAFCCWPRDGGGVRKFSMERVKGDLDWFAKNKLPFCYCVDSNFGILDRDMEIAEYVVHLKKTYGYPEKFENTSAKNREDVTFAINSKLDEVGLNRGIFVAVQSMSPKVLEIIGRKNIPVDNFSKQLARYRQNGMYASTDIMLGLPGETYDSFSHGLFEVMEAGQHTNIMINCCECLPNTALYSKEMREKYQIKTVRSHLRSNHVKVSEDSVLGSRSEMIVETSDMSRDDWRKSYRLGVFTQVMHYMGLVRFISFYMRKARNVSYYDFYIQLFDWVEKESKVFKSNLDRVCKNLNTFLQGKGDLFYSDERTGDMYWHFDEGFFLNCVLDFEEAFDELEEYFKGYITEDYEAFADLFKYQRNIILLPDQKERALSFNYDWPDYFKDIYDEAYAVPYKRSLKLSFGGCEYKDFFDYSRNIAWFGKRYDSMINKDVKEIL